MNTAGATIRNVLREMYATVTLTPYMKSHVPASDPPTVVTGSAAIVASMALGYALHGQAGTRHKETCMLQWVERYGTFLVPNPSGGLI